MSTKSKKASLSKRLDKKFGQLGFGDALRAWRESEEKSQVEFAEELEISVQSLCDLEKGRRIPTPKRASVIAGKLGIPEQVLIRLALSDSLKEQGLKYEVQLKKGV